jgi:hypothetical protein
MKQWLLMNVFDGRRAAEHTTRRRCKPASGDDPCSEMADGWLIADWLIADWVLIVGAVASSVVASTTGGLLFLAGMLDGWLADGWLKVADWRLKEQWPVR